MSVVDPIAQSVLTETIGAVRILTLNRPKKLNAADLEMQQNLLAHLKATAADGNVRVLILTGAGRAFSAGGDRSVLRAIAAGEFTQQEEFGRVYVDTVRCMLGMSIPTIAAVPGPAVGYAAGLVALCDMVVMGETGFLCDPHVKFGIAADAATQLIWPRLASNILAKELLMSGRQVPAQEAVDIGLANRLCPAGQERTVALEMAEMFTGSPAPGIAATKRRFNDALLEEFERMNAIVGGRLA